MNVLTITKENYEQEVTNSDKPVLLDFFANWCGPCKMISPLVEEIANEVIETAKVGKINVDEQPELASTFQVRSIPMLAVVHNGEVIDVSVGAKSKQAIIDMLNF